MKSDRPGTSPFRESSRETSPTFNWIKRKFPCSVLVAFLDLSVTSVATIASGDEEASLGATTKRERERERERL